MDLHYKQEVTVGALVLVGVGLFVAGTIWLGGGTLTSRPSVAVVFPDAGTLKRGSPVKVSGVTLGNVEKIEYQGVGRVRVDLTLDRRVEPRRDARAVLATVGLVADAVIKFHPGDAAEPLPEGQVITGEVERGIMDLGAELGAQAKGVLTNVEGLTSQRLADDLHATMTALQRFMQVYADTTRGPTAALTATLGTLRALTARLDSTLAATNVNPALARVDTLAARLTTLTTQFTTTGAQLDSLLAGLNAGRGTLGRFARDTTFYDNSQKLLRSLQEFVDELRKHPGKITVQLRVF